MWLWLACVHNVPAPTLVEPEPAVIRYYTVDAANARAAIALTHELGPLGEGKRWPAVTNWHVDWHTSGPGCGKVQVDATIQINFPQWNPPAGTPDEELKRWRRFTDGLMIHEQGHVDRDRAMIAALPAKLAAAGCGNGKRVADAAFDAVRAENIEYDRVTDHGRGQSRVVPDAR